MAVRGAGFPAGMVLQLAAEDVAHRADEVSRIEDAAREAIDQLITLELGRAPDRRSRKALKQARSHIHANPVAGLPALDLAKLPAAFATCAASQGAMDEARKSFSRSFTNERQVIRQRLRAMARDERVHEAILWQNRAAYQTAIRPLAEVSVATPENKVVRAREGLLALYLQRYCMKNETVGFFGPVGWATVEPDGAALSSRPGPSLLASRSVYFECWCIDEVAKALASNPSLRPWLCPRLLAYFALDGTRLLVPGREPVELPPGQARALSLCDGLHTAKDIARRLVDDGQVGSPGELYEMLDLAQQMEVIHWTLEVPFEPYPERSLRGLLQLIEDNALRTSLTGQLDELEQLRAQVADAAGNPDALDRQLGQLEQRFTALTGTASVRGHGAAYAGRTLLYEDCRRSNDVTLGPGFIGRIAPALALLLTSARWYTWQIGRKYREAIEAMHGQLAKELGSASVPVPVLQHVFMKDASLSTREGLPDPVRDVRAELWRKWSAILERAADARAVEFSARALEPLVAESFDAPGPGWTDARYVSPDLMVCADNDESLGRGEFQVVLGEMHISNTLLASFLAMQHPDRAVLSRQVTADLPEPHVVPFSPKEWEGQRTSRRVFASHAMRLEFLAQPADAPPDRVLRSGDLVVESTETGLCVRSRDGSFRADAVDFMGVLLSGLCNKNFCVLGDMEHVPRVVIDGLIVAREQWRFAPAQLAFAREREPEARFFAARRWARLSGVPRFVFLKVPIEPKPIYVDLASPIFVDLFAKTIRHAEEAKAPRVTITEMLPTPQQLWLTDAHGNRYVSELRAVALDALSAAR